MVTNAVATPTENSIVSWCKQELQPSRLFPNLISGGVTSVLTVIESVSYAALIFSGAMASDISTGIAVTLTSAAVAGLVMSLTSSYPGTIAVDQWAEIEVRVRNNGGASDDGGIQDVLAALVAHPRGADRTVEGDARDGQRRRRPDQGRHLWIDRRVQ